MLADHILLAFLWILYGVLHSVLAGPGVKRFFEKTVGRFYIHYRLFYTVFAFVGLIAIVWFQLIIPTVNLFKPSAVTGIAGFIIGAAGLVLMLICIKKYFMKLSGLQSLFREKVQTALIISGVHRFVRHPLYLGTFLFIWGLFLLLPALTLLISNTIITAYTLVGTELEEKKLVAEFGEQYRNYQKYVPKLIPNFKAVENPTHGHRQNSRVGR